MKSFDSISSTPLAQQTDPSKSKALEAMYNSESLKPIYPFVVPPRFDDRPFLIYGLPW